MDIQWDNFFYVLVAALIGACFVVLCYATGLRLMVRAGRSPVVGPAEFTDAITVITDKEAARALKAAEKAARKSPLTEAQKQLAFVGACACFTLCGAAMLAGVLLIVFGPGH